MAKVQLIRQEISEVSPSLFSHSTLKNGSKKEVIVGVHEQLAAAHRHAAPANDVGDEDELFRELADSAQNSD